MASTLSRTTVRPGAVNGVIEIQVQIGAELRPQRVAALWGAKDHLNGLVKIVEVFDDPITAECGLPVQGLDVSEPGHGDMIAKPSCGGY